ncbi:hypothetical protein ACL02S_22250 [Nocardia sp. 004]|uniref:hypothetical protein n=1 Tax=Nocardia sp. 004 TaxID=3385978 RepID=UPI0039A304AE
MGYTDRKNLLTAKEAAAVASEIAGEHIGEITFRSAMSRAKDHRFKPVIGADQLLKWPASVAHAFGKMKQPADRLETEAAQWGEQHGLMTELQCVEAARHRDDQARAARGEPELPELEKFSVNAFRIAVSRKTRTNPAPDPITFDELIDAQVPLEFLQMRWFRTAEYRKWLSNKPGKGNRQTKRLDDAQLGPEEWTARRCAEESGMRNAYDWHRHCRTHPEARSLRVIMRGGTYIWYGPQVRTYLAAQIPQRAPRNRST